MSDLQFFRTVMGQRFYEGTVPALVRELARLNTNLEKLVEHLERNGQPETTPEPPAKEDATP